MKNAALLLALSLTVPLAGCFGGESTPPPPPPGPVETFLINAAPGASTTVDDPQFGPQVHVLLEDNFISASGEDCRRATVRSQRQEAEVVVICRQLSITNPLEIFPSEPILPHVVPQHNENAASGR